MIKADLGQKALRIGSLIAFSLGKFCRPGDSRKGGGIIHPLFLAQPRERLSAEILRPVGCHFIGRDLLQENPSAPAKTHLFILQKNRITFDFMHPTAHAN
jgi:hypothetical protein